MLKTEDKEWINEQIKENASSEAPASVNFRGYYRGFSIQTTNRDPDVKVAPLLTKAMKAVDWMIENGFKPSWNEETNKGNGNGKSEMEKLDEKQAKQDACKHTNIKFVQSKTEKNPGRWFKSCANCGKFLGWQDGEK